MALKRLQNLKNKRFKGFILKLFTRKKNDEFDKNSVRKILLLRYDRIGDMIISTPILRELKQACKKFEIDVLASKTNYEIIRYNPYVSNIYLNHKRNFFRDLPVLLKLRKKKYDLAIEFDHSVIPHAILRLKIISPRYVFSVQKDGRYGVNGSDLNLYSYFSKKQSNEHAVDRWLRTISPFRSMITDKSYEIHIPDYFENKANFFFNRLNNENVIGFNFKGAVEGKEIPFSDFVTFANWLEINYSSYKILVFSMPTDLGEIISNISKFGLTNVIVSEETLSILHVSALVRRLKLMITPDTSLVHIASTFNIPVVSIHENNLDSYNLFKPMSKYSDTLFSEYSNSLKGYSMQELISKVDSALVNSASE